MPRKDKGLTPEKFQGAGGAIGGLPWTGNGNGNGNGDEYGGGGTVYGGGGYGGYGGYGGGSSGPTDNQRKAFGVLGAITGENADILGDAFDNTLDVLNEAQRGNENLRDYNLLANQRKVSSDWFKDYKNSQNVYTQLKQKNDNGFLGSLLYNTNDVLRDVLDSLNANARNALRENNESINASYYESLMQNINSRNEAAADTEKALRELYSDYIAQGNNIHPDLVGGLVNQGEHGLNDAPDWLDTDFYDEHKAVMPDIEKSNFILPDQANTQIREQGLSNRDHNIASAAMSSYWDRLNRGYDQRGGNA